MTPATYNLTIFKGATFHFRMTCDDGATPPLPVDLTGWSVFAHARSLRGGATIDFVPTIIDPAGGVVDIVITDEQTAQLAEGLYKWDLLFENQNSEVLPPYIQGSCEVIKPTTQTV